MLISNMTGNARSLSMSMLPYANARRHIGENMSYTAFISQETYGSDSAIKTVNSTRRDFDLQGEEYNPYIGSVPFSNTKPLINIGVSLASFNQYPGVNIKKVLGTICTGKFMFMIAFFAFSVLGVVNAVPTASEYMDSTPHFSNIRLEFGIANTYESNKVVDLLFDTGPVIDIVNGTDTRFYFTDDFDVVRKRLSFGDGEVDLVEFSETLIDHNCQIYGTTPISGI